MLLMKFWKVHEKKAPKRVYRFIHRSRPTLASLFSSLFHHSRVPRVDHVDCIKVEMSNGLWPITVLVTNGQISDFINYINDYDEAAVLPGPISDT